ncbi:MAG: CRTAC1 family protein [Planctomycetota bacterium]|nr:CRTAC1 family protein [Planctomycetota bacterium]
MRNTHLFILLLSAGCWGAPDGAQSTTPDPASVQPYFTVEDDLIPFQHDAGARGKRHICEIIGSGAGFFDADGDGDLDLFMVNGAPKTPDPDGSPPRDTLLIQQDGIFADRGIELGIAGESHGLGLAIGDIDADGDADVFVANDGPDQLYLNDGNGHFSEEALARGISIETLSSAAAFVDVDLDGDLDLFVGSYLSFDENSFIPCIQEGHEIYCGPGNYPALPCYLLINDGNGNFQDVSMESGVALHPAKALGVVSLDIEGDGDPDLYVANDGEANFLLINRWKEEGKLRFDEEALLAGCAYGEGAKAEAGMGVEAADLDGDGDEEILVTNLEAQSNSCYRNDGGGLFLETSFSNGIAPPGLPLIAFGIRALDANLDGHLDIFIANGHINDRVSDFRGGVSSFAQPDHLFLGDGNRFTLTDYARPVTEETVARSLVSGDIDDDGDLDLLITNWNRTPRFLRSNSSGKAPVLGLQLEGNPPASNIDAIGARITVRSGNRTQVREHRVQSSYFSSHDPRQLFTLPAEATSAEVTILWPDGTNEQFQLDAGSYHQLKHGTGLISSSPFAPAQ